ncbi:hypothetical protein Vretimale_5413 [Volvox reticuliferus]|uniref:Uncharacterized protein n=1 Tax=Volvox reticuliferus TaxID=1737510 RepID=A0A8J4C376_9CHLO|nr:hypothetical protein Vretifemale_3836 [Volvox reticuliferus]GIM00269.1 hypothetical protein Vretimale_5413 [Volvox reticuliferus]
MMQLLRPKYIQELAALLDVKAAPEWALPYALGSAPLPEGWTHLISDDGDVLFVSDMRPQAPQREHPLLDRAAQALAQLRANGAGGSEAQMLGPFENLESPAVEYFYFDVRTGQQVPEFECPPGAIIQPLQSDILQLLTEPGPAPSGLEQQQQQQDLEHPIGQGAYIAPGALEANISVDENAAALKESGSAGPDVGSKISGWGPDAAVSTEEGGLAGEGIGGGGPVATATPASIGVRTSRPQSASTSRNGNVDNAAAAGVATGSQSPGSSGSASKLPRRQGSERDAGSWQETRGASGSSAGTAPVAATAVPNMRAMPASSGALPTQPAPPPPGVRLADATVATVGSSKSLGLGSDDHNDEDNDEVTYVRGESTTAGYAGSVSENSSGSRISGGGIGVGIGNSRGGRNSGSGRSNGSAASGSGSDGSRSMEEALSRSASNRSSETVGSERNSEGRIGAGSSTNGGKTAGGIGARAPVPPPSGRLTFYGWWFEDIESPDLTFRIDTNPTAGGGLAPRHCKLVYDFATSSYNFTMRDPVTPPAPGQPHERVPVLTVPGIYGDQVAMCDTGRPADLWDLHLGARLRVLGRQVILKNSDLATAQWHANYFKQLCVLRDKLHQEVQKYKPRVIRPGLVADKGDVRLQTGQQLRHVVLQVRELVADLQQYRPNKAESFMAALPIQL